MVLSLWWSWLWLLSWLWLSLPYTRFDPESNRRCILRSRQCCRSRCSQHFYRCCCSSCHRGRCRTSTRMRSSRNRRRLSLPPRTGASSTCSQKCTDRSRHPSRSWCTPTACICYRRTDRPCRRRRSTRMRSSRNRRRLSFDNPRHRSCKRNYCTRCRTHCR